MRIQRAKKRVEEAPLLKPKRVDLNEAQLHLQREVSEISLPDLALLEGEVLRAHESLKACSHSGSISFYKPSEIAQCLGLSKQTVEKYADGYLRIVRREQESLEEFRERKLKAHRLDAPVGVLPRADVPEDFRVLSSRVLVFLVLAPTQVRGDNPNLKSLRETLSGISQLQACRSLPIHKNSGVTTWQVSG
jgi:hypothetical protein